jgi:hypothetical protein
MFETVIDILNGAIAYAAAHAAPLMGLSLAMLIATLVALPIVIARLPRSYFNDESRPRLLSRHLVIHWLLTTLKNLLGLMLVLIGLLLLFLPGQGILTLIIGLTIMNYPGKFAFERWLVRRPRVLPALNWLRSRSGAPPFDDP